MVKISFTLALLFSMAAWSQVEFHRIYSDVGFDRGEGIDQMADSSYIVTGTSTSFANSTAQAFLMKLDKTGTRQWSLAYGDNEIQNGKRVFAVENDGFYCLGQTNSNATGDFNFWMFKTDLNGELLWEKQYGSLGWELIEDAQILKDTSFVLVGSTDATADGLKNSVVIRLNAAGDTIWRHEMVNPGHDRIRDILQISDTSFVVSGTTYNNDSLAMKAFMTCFHFDGTQLWTEQYGDNGNFSLNGMTLFNNQIFAVGYFLEDVDSTQEADEYNIRTDLNGVINFSNVYQFPGKRTMDGIVNFGTDEKVLAVFTRDDEFAYVGGDDLFFLRYDVNWNPTSFDPWEVKANEPEYFGDMIQTLDSMAVAVGSTTDPGKGDLAIFVTKIGPDETYPNTVDNLDTTELVQLIEIDEDLSALMSMYPNPMTETVSIDWKGIEKGVLSFYSMDGRKVLTTTVYQPGKHKLDVSKLDAGVYHILLNSNQQSYSYGQLIKR